MCSQNTGKIAKGNTFLITLQKTYTENSGFSFRRNFMSLEFDLMVLVKGLSTYKYCQQYIPLGHDAVYEIIIKTADIFLANI